MRKLQLLRAIHLGGIARQRATEPDFESLLELVDQLELEGLIDDVYRHRETADSPVDFVKITRLGVRGVSYLNAMSDEN